MRGVPRAQQWRQHLKKIIIKWLQLFSLRLHKAFDEQFNHSNQMIAHRMGSKHMFL